MNCYTVHRELIVFLVCSEWRHLYSLGVSDGGDVPMKEKLIPELPGDRSSRSISSICGCRVSWVGCLETDSEIKVLMQRFTMESCRDETPVEGG